MDEQRRRNRKKNEVAQMPSAALEARLCALFRQEYTGAYQLGSTRKRRQRNTGSGKWTLKKAEKSFTDGIDSATMCSIDEYAEAILDQVYKDLVRQFLSVLGLAFRLDGATVDRADWVELFKLTSNVIACVSHTDPGCGEQAIWIGRNRGGPTDRAWTTLTSQLKEPYWIGKADIHRMQALEAALDRLTTNSRH